MPTTPPTPTTPPYALMCALLLLAVGVGLLSLYYDPDWRSRIGAKLRDTLGRARISLPPSINTWASEAGATGAPAPGQRGLAVDAAAGALHFDRIVDPIVDPPPPKPSYVAAPVAPPPQLAEVVERAAREARVPEPPARRSVVPAPQPAPQPAAAPSSAGLRVPVWLRGGAHLAPTVGQAADLVPPGMVAVLDVLAYLDQRDGTDAYRYPIGWSVAEDGALALATATYSARRPHTAQHAALTGRPGAGRGTFARTKLLTLFSRLRPDELQVAIFDGAGVDFPAWQGLPHVWGLAQQTAAFGALCARITDERAARAALLAQAGVTHWAEYVAAGHTERAAMPLLVVFVAEGLLFEPALRDAGQDWAAWVNALLVTGATYGIALDYGRRTLVGTPPDMRRQFDLFLAGANGAPGDDRANTGGHATAQIVAGGGVPPSLLPQGPGYFTVAQGAAVATVRTSRVARDEEAQLLRDLRALYGGEAPLVTLAEQVAAAAALVQAGRGFEEAVAAIWPQAEGAQRTLVSQALADALDTGKPGATAGGG